MKGRYLSLAVLFWLAVLPLRAQELPSGFPEDVGISSERLERLTRVFQGYVDEGRLPGAVVYVARGEQVAYLGTFGHLDRERGVPMPADALFRIASQSKAVISIGILILQEQGKLLIGDPVSNYLPEWAQTTVAVPKEGGGYDVVPARRGIRIRDLLTHTAGVGYGYGPAAERWKEAGIQGWYFAHREEPIRETVRRMAALPMERQPGESYVYGYSTDILGAVIEAADGRPLDVFLREELFEPLGMHDTAFYVDPSKAGRLATVYSSRGNGLERAPDGAGMETQGQYVEGPRASFSGGAGLVSTARDYGRFLQMIVNGGELFGARILSPTTVDLLSRNHVQHIADYGVAGGTGFGLAFGTLENEGRFGQPGYAGSLTWGGAYHTNYWVDPVQDLVVVYMTQVIPAQGLDDHGKLRTLVYQAIVE